MFKVKLDSSLILKRVLKEWRPWWRILLRLPLPTVSLADPDLETKGNPISWVKINFWQKEVKSWPQAQQRKWTYPWLRSLQWHRQEQSTMLLPMIEIWILKSVLNLSVLTFLGWKGCQFVCLDFVCLYFVFVYFHWLEGPVLTVKLSVHNVSDLYFFFLICLLPPSLVGEASTDYPFHNLSVYILSVLIYLHWLEGPVLTILVPSTGCQIVCS